MFKYWIEQIMFYIKDQINIKIKNKQTVNNNIKTKQFFHVIIILYTPGKSNMER